MTEPQQHQVPRRRSREEAARLVIEYKQSKLSRRAFCRLHGLSIATLDNYRKRHAGSANDKPAVTFDSSVAASVTFVPVELIEHSARQTQQIRGAGIFIELNQGRRIAVTAGFDAATLKRLIAVLEQA
jgi:transposase-like protein